MRLIAVTLLLCCSLNAYSQQGDTAIIKELNSRWLNAIVNRDTAALSSVLADDFIMVNPAGNKQSKADNLANVLQPNARVTSVNIDKVAVRMLNENVGILSAWTTFVISADGKQTTGHNCYQDVYVKRANGWKAVSAQVTLLGM